MAGTLGTITYTIYPASAVFEAHYYSGNEGYDFSFTQLDCTIVNDHLVYTSQNTYYEGTTLFVAYNHNYEYPNQISDTLTIYLPDCTLYAWQGSGGVNYRQRSQYNILLQPDELFGWTDEAQTEILYAWDIVTSSSESPLTLYTKTATPTTSTSLYDSTGTLVTDYTITAVTENGITIGPGLITLTLQHYRPDTTFSYNVPDSIYLNNTQVTDLTYQGSLTFQIPKNQSCTITIGSNSYLDLYIAKDGSLVASDDSSGSLSYAFTPTANCTIGVSMQGTCCIPYYTPVNYYNGSTKTAEEVQIGDKLLGYNEDNQCFTEVEVLNIIYKLRSELVKIKTQNCEIEITPDHPILTDQGWAVYDVNINNYLDVNKIPLTDNLKVLTKDGIYEQINSIEYIQLEQPMDTYTFNVTDGIDTYVAANLISHNIVC